MSEYSQEVSQINRKVCASTLACLHVYIHVFLNMEVSTVLIVSV